MITFASVVAAGLCLLPAVNGVQLFGNSFGILGVNASYDYIGIQFSRLYLQAITDKTQ